MCLGGKKQIMNKDLMCPRYEKLPKIPPLNKLPSSPNSFSYLPPRT